MTRAGEWRLRPALGARGFTLFEIMIAIAILGTMMVIAWGTISQTLKTKQRYEAIQEQSRLVRVAMSRVVRDLSMAFLSANEDRSVQDPRTIFIEEDSGDVDGVRFTTFSHTPLYAEANESDQTMVAYRSASDPEERGVTNLVRTEYRRLAMANEGYARVPKEVDVIFPNVTRFNLDYWDFKDKEWKDTWNTQQATDATPRLPERVRVTLGYKDSRGREVTIVTQAKILMQELVTGYAN